MPQSPNLQSPVLDVRPERRGTTQLVSVSGDVGIAVGALLSGRVDILMTNAPRQGA